MAFLLLCVIDLTLRLKEIARIFKWSDDFFTFDVLHETFWLEMFDDFLNLPILFPFPTATNIFTLKCYDSLFIIRPFCLAVVLLFIEADLYFVQLQHMLNPVQSAESPCKGAKAPVYIYVIFQQIWRMCFFLYENLGFNNI